MAPHWSGVGVAPLICPRQDETSEPLLYAGWMAGPYRVEDVTRGQNDDPVTSGIRVKSDRGGPKQNHSSCSPKKFLKVLAAQRWWECVPGCRSSVRMTMHEVVHEMVVGEYHEPNSEGSGSAWKAYMNARVAGLEYPNGKGVVCATSRGLDMALHL
ncbi:hypothetical protein Tco_0744512 [Tanacetum coccineum]